MLQERQVLDALNALQLVEGQDEGPEAAQAVDVGDGLEVVGQQVDVCGVGDVTAPGDGLDDLRRRGHIALTK